MWLCVASKLFTIKTFFKFYEHHLSTVKNAVNVLSKSPVRFWPWIPCMLASALLAPLRLGWLWVSTNDTCWLKTHCEHKHCWLRMPLVCNSILPVTIVNSDVHLYLANVTKVHNKKPIFFVFVYFVCPSLFYCRIITRWDTSPWCQSTTSNLKQAAQDVC